MYELIAVAVLGLIAGWLIFDRYKSYKANKKLQQENDSIRKQNMLDDLSLATSEQLLAELRNRPTIKYIYLTPMNYENGIFGLNIEAHNINPQDTVAILRVACEVTSQSVSPPNQEGTENGQEGQLD